jgi:hypothetical protein
LPTILPANVRDNSKRPDAGLQYEPWFIPLPDG